MFTNKTPLVNPIRGTTEDKRFFLFLVCAALVHGALITLSPFGLSPDEAHYWDWSRRLDWAYYSKGPGVAILIALSTKLFGDSAFAVRLPALLCSLAFDLLLYTELRRRCDPARALSLTLLVLTALLFSSMHVLMTTDPPCALLWLGTLCAVCRWAESGKDRYFLLTFCCAGVALLFKYTAIVLPLGLAIAIVVTPELRRRLTWNAIVSGMALFALIVSPIIIWNIEHEWVNFGHNAAHLTGGEKETRLRPRFFGELLGGQIGLVGPLLFFLCALVLVKRLIRWRYLSPDERLLVAASAPLAGVCVAVSMTKNVYANWPMPIYLGAVLLVAESAPLIDSYLKRFLRYALALNVLSLCVMYSLFLGLTFGLPASRLPTKKLAGWNELGERVQEILDENSSPKLHGVIAENYDVGAAIAFAAKSHPLVLVGVFDGRRMNQYDIWGGWEDAQGRDLVIVYRSPEALASLAPKFQRIEKIAQPLTISYSGERLREFHFAVGREYDGSPVPFPSRR